MVGREGGTHARQAPTRACTIPTCTRPSIVHYRHGRHRTHETDVRTVSALCRSTGGTVFRAVRDGMDGLGNRTRDEVRTVGDITTERRHPSVRPSIIRHYLTLVLNPTAIPLLYFSFKIIS